MAEEESGPRVERRPEQVSAMAGGREEAVAFDRLRAFARKVATELGRAGVAHDTYVAHEAHQAEVTTPGGLFRGARTERVAVPERRAEIDGWRVLSDLREETLLQDVTGAIRSTRFTSRRFEVWLLRAGRMVVVELRGETVSNNVRGSLANVVPTKVVGPRELDQRTARELDGRGEWRTSEKRANGMIRSEEWRHRHSPRPSTPPCSTLSKQLSELRKRAG